MDSGARTRALRLSVSNEAAGFIHDHGGRLFIWTERQACCRGRTMRRAYAAVTPPEGSSFLAVPSTDGIEWFLATDLRLPEVNVAMSRFGRRHPVAYWPGCLRG